MLSDEDSQSAQAYPRANPAQTRHVKAANTVDARQGSGFDAEQRSAPWAAAMLSAATVFLAAVPAKAESNRIPNLGEPLAPRLSLEDPRWQQALELGEFTQVDPREGSAPTFPTQVRMFRDDSALHIFVRLFDAQPNQIVAREMLRDASLDGDDIVRVVIDPFGRGREGYLFEVNPRGARRDALLEGDRIIRYDWDGRWTAQAGIDDQGWWAVLRIPFATLSYDSAVDTWGINVERTIRRLQERSRWVSPSRAQLVTAISRAGHMSGFAGIPPGRGIEVVPNVRFSNDRRGGGASDSNFEFGLDASYRLRESYTLALTVNTDFGEAEADARQVNLTRFPLRFPEKRDFFLHDAAFFRFGGIDYNPFPFFTRRIGLDASGQPTPLRAGVRLTGREGPWTVAALAVAVEDASGEQSDNLGVLRVSRQLGDQFSMGMIHTAGDPRIPGDNSLSGLDAAWLDNDTRFGVVEARLWGMRSRSDLAGASDTAFGFQLQMPNEPWRFYQYVGEVGDRFDPGLGFVSRRGIREYIHSTRYRWRPESGPLRYIDYVFDPYVVTDLDGRLLSSTVDVPEVFLQTPLGDSLFFKVAHVREVLDEGFMISRGVEIPAGDYRWRQAVLELKSTDARPLSTALTLRRGGFYDGDRNDVAMSMEWRPVAGMALTAAGERRQVALPGGRFRVDITSAGGRVNLTPALSLSALAQYDNVSGMFGLNARLRWIVGNDNSFYLVYDRAEDRFAPGRPVVRERGLAKIGWAILL